MPKQQSPFIGLISALLPVLVASAIFIQVSNTNPALKQKVQNILGRDTESEETIKPVKTTKTSLTRQNYNYTISETKEETNKKNVLAAETTSPVVNLIPANNNTTTNNTTSTTSTATSNNSGYTYYGITSTDKKNMMSYILDNIKQIQDKLDPASLKFNKIKLNGRENSPAIDNIGKNNAYLWINQDKNKLYLKGQGGSRIELLTSKFFARDLRFKGDINILESLNVVGDANIDSDLTIGGTLEATGNTTFDADLLVKKNLQVLGTSAFESIIFANNDLNVKGISSLGAATLANTNINGTLNVEALLSGVTAKFSGNLSAGSANLTGLLTGTTGNFSGNVNLSGTGSTLGNAFFSSPLATNTFTFLGGTISSSNLNLTGLLTGTTANFSGNLSGNQIVTASFSNPNANQLYSFGGTIGTSDIILTNLLSGNNAKFTGNMTLGSLSLNDKLYFGTGIVGKPYIYADTGNSLKVDALLTSNFEATISHTFRVSAFPIMTIDSTGLNLQGKNLIYVNNFTAASAYISGNLGLSYTSTLSASYFSAATSDKTFNFDNGTLASTNAVFSGNVSLGSAYISGVINQPITASINQIGPYLSLNNNSNDQLFQFYNSTSGKTQRIMNSGGDFNFLNDNSNKKMQFITTDGGGFEFIIFGSNALTINSNGNTILNGSLMVGTDAANGYRIAIPNSTTPGLPNSNKGVANAWSVYSDVRLKENIIELTGAISTINSLRGVSFDWKSSKAHEIGFIAQEIEPLLPTIVSTDDKGYKAVDYSRLTPVLVEGIKEQQGQIETLSNAIGALNLSSLQDLYNKFNTSLENLSMSTEDGKLVVNSGLTVTGEALFNNAKFTGNVQVGQIKVDSLENDISIKASPCVDMDGNINEATCDTNKISIMKNKAGNVEMFDGKVKIKPNGNVLGEKVQAKAFSNSDSSTPSNSDSCTPKDFKFGEKDGKAYIFYCTSDSKWVRSELSSY